MVEVGKTGNLSGEWQIQNTRRNALSSLYGQQVNYSAAISSLGADFQDELDHIGIELQLPEGSNPLDFDFDCDFLNNSRVLWNGNNNDKGLFQSSDASKYTRVDFEHGSYNVLSEKQYASSVGINYENDSDKPYDFIKFGNNVASFTDLVFAGTGDGKADRIGVDLRQVADITWGLATTFDIQEVDAESVESIKNSVPKHILDKIEKALTAYDEGSAEYNAKFLEVAAELMDQEGYTKGNTVPSPANDKNEQNSSNFNVTRDSNGQVRITLNTDKDFELKGVGTVKGSGEFSLGVTSDGSNQTVIQAGNRNNDATLDLSLVQDVVNLDAYGQNVNADFNSKIGSYYNVNWNVTNGNINSENADRFFLNVEGANNTFNLGNNAYVIDESQDNNVFNWKGNTVKNK